jgi:hypothetical protein
MKWKGNQYIVAWKGFECATAVSRPAAPCSQSASVATAASAIVGWHADGAAANNKCGLLGAAIRARKRVSSAIAVVSVPTVSAVGALT